MSEKPQESSQDRFLAPKEPSMTQNDQESSFLPSTEPQATFPSSVVYGDMPARIRHNTASGQGYDTNSYNPYDSQSNFSIDTSFTSSTHSSQQVYGEGFHTHYYNPLGRQTGANITYMTSQRYNGDLLGDSGGGYGPTSYNAFGSQSNSPDFAYMNPQMTLTPGNFSNNSHIGQSHFRGGYFSADMMQDTGGQYGPVMHNHGNLNDAPTASVGARMTNTTNTACFQSASSYNSSGLLRNSGPSFTSSTANSLHDFSNLAHSGMQGEGYGSNYSDLFRPQANFSITPGGNIPISQTNSGLTASMSLGYSGGLLTNSDTLFTGSTANSQQVPLNLENIGIQCEEYDRNNYNTSGHQPGRNVSFMSPQQNSGSFSQQAYYNHENLGMQGGGCDINNYDPFESQLNFSDIASKNPQMTPALGNVNNNGNIEQSQSSSRLSPADMMHNDGNLNGARTTSVRTRMTNTTTRTASSQSMSSVTHEERQEWTIKKRLTICDVNGEFGRLQLSKSEVERHIADLKNKVKPDQGMEIEVYDHDTSTTHNMYLAFRHAYYITGNWGPEFVERRELKTGEEIGLSWDTSSSRLKFSVLSRPKEIGMQGGGYDINNNNSNIEQSQSSSGLSPADMMHYDGNLNGAPTTSVGTRISNNTNTASSQSHEEHQEWAYKKILTDSDTKNAFRLYLAKTFVDYHLMKHISEADFQNTAKDKTGILIQVYDVDTSTQHEMHLTFGRQYYLGLHWRTSFVNRRELKAGQEIGLSWDTSTSRLNFKVLSPPEEKQ